MPQDVLSRLTALGIEPIDLDLKRHTMVHRDGFVALIERTRVGGYRAAGTAGLLTERGLAPLVWRGEEAWFITRGSQVRATADQNDLRR
jgi:hypothetical protein